MLTLPVGLHRIRAVQSWTPIRRRQGMMGGRNTASEVYSAPLRAPNAALALFPLLKSHTRAAFFPDGTLTCLYPSVEASGIRNKACGLCCGRSMEVVADAPCRRPQLDNLCHGQSAHLTLSFFMHHAAVTRRCDFTRTARGPL